MWDVNVGQLFKEMQDNEMNTSLEFAMYCRNQQKIAKALYMELHMRGEEMRMKLKKLDPNKYGRSGDGIPVVDKVLAKAILESKALSVSRQFAKAANRAEQMGVAGVGAWANFQRNFIENMSEDKQRRTEEKTREHKPFRV